MKFALTGEQVRLSPALIAVMASLFPAGMAAWRMAPAFGPGAVLPLFVPPLVWAVMRSPHRSSSWIAITVTHLVLLFAALFLAILPLPLPTVIWGGLVWCVMPLMVLKSIGKGKTGLLHGLLWIVSVWSTFGLLVAIESSME